MVDIVESLKDSARTIADEANATRLPVWLLEVILSAVLFDVAGLPSGVSGWLGYAALLAGVRLVFIGLIGLLDPSIPHYLIVRLPFLPVLLAGLVLAAPYGMLLR